MCIINSQSNENIINEYNSWQAFPWQRIYLRVLMIKRQIYVNSKKHNLINVRNLQKYLINCNEAKVLLINKILARTYLYYQHHERNKFLIDNEQKFNLFSCLFDNDKLNNKTINNITKHVKQHLICISIDPTLKARLSKDTVSYLSKGKINNNLREDNKINYFSFSKSSNYFLIRTITLKLQYSNYINKSITNWLYHQDCLDLSLIYNLKYLKCLNTLDSEFYEIITKTSYNLETLFVKFLLIDPCWYFFNFIKKENKKKLLLINNLKYNSLKTANKPSYDYSQSLKNIIKLFLYRRNYFGYNKINLFITHDHFLSRINKMCRQFYDININLISISIIRSCNKLTNNFIHQWIKKQLSFKFLRIVDFSKIQRINECINRYIYICNTNNYYISFI